MSLLAKKVAKYEWAKALAQQLGAEIAAELGVGTRAAGRSAANPALSEAEPSEPRKKRRRALMTPELKARIEARLKQGDTKSSIARDEGIAETTVYRINNNLRAAQGGSPARKHHGNKTPPEIEAEIIRLVKEGKQPAELAVQFKKNVATIYRVMKDAGIKRDAIQVAKPSEPAAAPPNGSRDAEIVRLRDEKKGMREIAKLTKSPLSVVHRVLKAAHKNQPVA